MQALSGALRCVILQAGEYLCAVPLTQVRRIVRGVDIHPLPGAAPELLGLAESSGEPLPVLDLARVVNAPPAGQAAFPVTVLAWVGPPQSREVVGLACDGALEIVEVATDGIAETSQGVVCGETTLNGAPVRLLNLERLGAE